MSQDSVLVEKNGILTVTEGQPSYMTAMLPSDYPQNHASNLLCLPNGDLLCVWFAGTQEGVADISVLCTRLRSNSNQWESPVRLSDDPTRSEQNPVLFLDPQGILWLMWTAQLSGNQDTAIVRYRQSRDYGETWGKIATLIDEPGTFIRQPVVVLPGGRWLLPVFYCTVNPGEKWVGNYDTSGVRISDDQGKTWYNVEVPDSLGCVHMCITPLQDGRLIALYRSRWADHIYQSFSEDEGITWSAPVPTSLPNNNSSIQVTTLHNGDLALVFNAMSAAGATERRSSLYDEIEDDSGVKEPEITAGRSAFWGAPRAPMSLAISRNNGESWEEIIHLDEGDGYCMTNNSQQKLNREFSYPTITQGTDGALHIAYTYFRQAIKYVRYPAESLC
ncbi:sialidase family protein [Vibrio mangrovi]|uniref:BNR/Asp-box repeat protein n=1 Tax=Vibrio mangrovi TaxID=474394 RepID=A0A1Y6ITQ1_9VIBR|nr:exo-alpha-sialidase [Vibrio mangrovi]MDW6004766.1 exo-alpha-sialidase [Vibrio mangrovi]SMS01057.1 BNR/Asp-box repeat protein [Vibrio mangrovi]